MIQKDLALFYDMHCFENKIGYFIMLKFGFIENEVKFYDKDMHDIDQCLISMQPEGFSMNRPSCRDNRHLDKKNLFFSWKLRKFCYKFPRKRRFFLSKCLLSRQLGRFMLNPSGCILIRHWSNGNHF